MKWWGKGVEICKTIMITFYLKVLTTTTNQTTEDAL